MARSSSGANAGRILLAEDNNIVQKVVLVILDRLGYKADAVTNGREAVASVEKENYDVILMDMQMPEMGGLEATRRIREGLPANRQPRIIALTANVHSNDRRRCMEAGMDEFLPKPVDKEALAQTLAAS